MLWRLRGKSEEPARGGEGRGTAPQPSKRPPRAHAHRPLRAGRRPFSVELQPGDVYVLHGAARWEWLHGIWVEEDVESARRAVVWRLLVD